MVDPRFAPIADAFAAAPDVTQGVMMSAFGLKVNGKIFAMFPKEQFVVKLPKARVEELIRTAGATRFDPGHGRVMKEWVVVPEGKADWLELAREAYEFVGRNSSR